MGPKNDVFPLTATHMSTLTLWDLQSHRHAHRDSLCLPIVPLPVLLCPHSYRQPVYLYNSHSCELSSNNSCLYPLEHKTQVRGSCVSSHSANSKTQGLVLYLEVSPLIHCECWILLWMISLKQSLLRAWMPSVSILGCLEGLPRIQQLWEHFSGENKWLLAPQRLKQTIFHTQLGEPVGFIGATYRGMGNFRVIILLRERNLSY